MMRAKFVPVCWMVLFGFACGGSSNASGGTDTGATTASPATTTQPPSVDPSPESSQSSGSPQSSGTQSQPADMPEPPACPYTPVSGTPAFALETVATGFSEPLLVVGDPVETDVLYVVQKGGQVKRLPPGTTTAPEGNWLELEASSSAGETGLLGFTFHPDFANNGLIYVAYNRTNTQWVVEEYRVADGSVELDSARLVYGSGQPASNHNGGMIAFGSDNMLYISVGDGGPQGDACGNGQNGDTHLGAILRIDPAADGTMDTSTGCGTCANPGECGGGDSDACANCPTVDGFDYTVPPDNPFVGDDSVRDEIYALGFRNPWRFAFDRDTDALYVADVGQNSWEEIDVVAAGANLGWGNLEGGHCFNQNDCDESAAPGQANRDGFVAPIAEYETTRNTCSVTGLGVYRACEVPDYAGVYFYSDACSGQIWGVSWDGSTATQLGELGRIPGGRAAYGGGYNAYGDVFIAAENRVVPRDGAVFRVTAEQSG